MSILGYGLTERRVNFGVIFWTTIVGGFFSSLVKWGSEVNMPPRVPGEVSPPGAHIDAWLGWLGFNSHSLDYVYQGATRSPVRSRCITGSSVLLLLLSMSFALFFGRVSGCGMACFMV